MRGSWNRLFLLKYATNTYGAGRFDETGCALMKSGPDGRKARQPMAVALRPDGISNYFQALTLRHILGTFAAWPDLQTVSARGYCYWSWR